MRRLVAAAVLALSWAGPAAAQPYAPAPPPPPAERSGILIGGGLGFGSFQVQYGDEEPEEYDDAFAWELRFGGMINPRLALGIDFFGTTQDEDIDGQQSSIYQWNIGAFVRWWAMPRLWLQGGIASARVGAATDTDDVRYSGVGLTGAVGFELLHRRSYALDAGLRLAGAGYDTSDSLGEDLRSRSISLAIAFNWFF
jgi:hypothetical protein